MIHSGDYITPYYCTGAMRFNKPILSYWFMTASYWALGIDFLSSRLPFLLAGCLTLWVTCKTSLTLFRDGRREAVLAAVILASNFQFIAESMRSTPDILLTFFISVSLYGFANLIFGKRFTTACYLFAFMGAASAIQTKGALGIVPVLFSLAFCAVRGNNTGVRPLRLIHPLIAALAAAAAVSWFAVVLFEHGSSALRLFFMDQVGMRVSGLSFAKIAGNMAAYAWAPVRHFFPWSLMVIAGLLWNRSAIREFFRQHGEECLFLIGWCVLVFLVFSGSNMRRTRFLLPAYPMFSILLSVLLVRIMDERPLCGVLDRMPRFLSGVGIACGAALGVAGMLFEPALAAGGAVLGFGVAVLYFTLLRRERFLLLFGAGLFIILFVSVLGVFVKPVSGVLPVDEMVERVMKLDRGDQRERGRIRVAILGNTIKLATAMTAVSGGRIEAVPLMEDGTRYIPEGFDALIVSGAQRDGLDPAVYRVEECGYEYGDIDADPDDLWGIFTSSADLRSVLSPRKEPFYLVTAHGDPPG